MENFMFKVVADTFAGDVEKKFATIESALEYVRLCMENEISCRIVTL
jgi:hypothetical protein